MKNINLILIFFALICTSCLGEKENDKVKEANNATKETVKKTIGIDAIKEQLCSNFPKELVLGYHPDANRIEIEPVDNGSGGTLHCDIKLFYGKKEYEFWKGHVYAHINQQEDPFWQYNPERNAMLYHRVEMGDKAVFISNMYQLQILKEGVLYGITPPNNGNTTSSGKLTKEIALEIAQHYKL
ncbi:MAG: hypothetical protein ACON5F_13090 [Jejuia sp.]